MATHFSLAGIRLPDCVGVPAAFRPQIGKVIDRATMFKAPGIEADLTGPQAQATSLQNTPETTLVPQEQLGSSHIDPLLQSLEEDAKKRIAESVPDPKNRLDWAIRLYALVRVEKAHETNYRLILGSQIAALKVISQGGGTRPIEQLRPIYQQACEASPEAYANFSFEKWHGFFSATGLAEVVKPDEIRLTLPGRSFLGWMATAGASEHKPL